MVSWLKNCQITNNGRLYDLCTLLPLLLSLSSLSSPLIPIERVGELSALHSTRLSVYLEHTRPRAAPARNGHKLRASMINFCIRAAKLRCCQSKPQAAT